MNELPITLLIVDDVPAVRRGLRMRLELEDDLRVLGEAADGSEGLDLASLLQPDVVILDVEMPVMDGFAAATALSSRAPRAHAVMLTLHDDSQTRARAAASGVQDFVAKHDTPEVLLAAIRRAAHRS
jgi:DNA-binding NarL/FixJ family response regulator